MIDLTPYFTREHFVVLEPAPRDTIMRRLMDACLGEVADADSDAAVKRRDILRAMKDQPLGAGFALSHARIPSGGNIRFSVGLLRQPAAFGRALDIHTVLCALIPDDRSREYLTFMARLSRFLMSPGAEEAFRNGDPDRILELVRNFQT